jgi:hypothetical protein
MSDESQTRPTLDTILERINALGTELRGSIESLRQEVNGNAESLRQEVNAFRVVVEDRLEQIETRLDRSQGIALEARADVRELRADLRNQFKQPA